MFYGRDSDVAELQALWRKRTSSLVVVSGRRRIGKSTLVEHFAALSKCRFIEITGLAPDGHMTNQTQLDAFCERLARVAGLPEVKVDSWPKAFDLLHAAIRGTARTVVFLDEISWMGHYDSSFAAFLKNAWDLSFSRRLNLVFVLAGSVSAWIQENILNSKAFVGRISKEIALSELPLADCRKFWGTAAARVSDTEILDVLSVTGGIPKYLEEMDPSLSAEENVRKLCFSPGGYLFREFDTIFRDVFETKSDSKLRLVEALAEGPSSLSELSVATGLGLNGHVTEDLRELCAAGFVASSEGLNPSTGKPARETRFRLRDNYVRFYLKYIRPKKAAIASGLYRFTSMESLPGWDVLLGLQFENLVLNNLPALAPRIGLGTAVVMSAAPYYRKGRKKGEGVQIDLLVQTGKSVCVVEIKRRRRIDASIEAEVREKLRRLKLKKDVSRRTALVYLGDLVQAVIDDGFFDFIVPAGDLLRPSADGAF